MDESKPLKMSDVDVEEFMKEILSSESDDEAEYLDDIEEEDEDENILIQDGVTFVLEKNLFNFLQELNQPSREEIYRDVLLNMNKSVKK